MSAQEPIAHTLLVVDDDDVFRSRLGRAFAARGYDVREARDGDEALRAAQQETPEFAVVDLRMPGCSGLEVVSGLHALDPMTRVVVLTGYGSIATAVEAVKLGAAHYLTKPADADEIEAAFARGAGDGDATLPIREDDAPSLARVEWEHIQRVLTDAGGNISVAAKRLGLHRRSLQRKLGKYPVSR
ncbi:MAG: response regulator [Polyangiales bacterium]|nr:response regulator [Myxococcales bacterium]MCB9660317.1 response regulator [Sandaracinaceae bacterium]